MIKREKNIQHLILLRISIYSKKKIEINKIVILGIRKGDLFGARL